MADVRTDFELLKSILSDLDRHLFGKGIAADNVEISQTILESRDAQRLLHPELIARMHERVNALGASLMKKAQGDVSKLTQLRKKYGKV